MIAYPTACNGKKIRFAMNGSKEALIGENPGIDQYLMTRRRSLEFCKKFWMVAPNEYDFWFTRRVIPTTKI